MRVSHEGAIVAIRMRQFGDVLATLGALRALKEAWPGRQLVYVADRHFHPVLRSFPFIDELLDSPPRVGSPSELVAYGRYVSGLRALRPGAVIDFHGNTRSAFLTLLSGAPLRAGWRVRGRRHAYTVAEPRAEFAAGAIRPRTSQQSAFALARHAGAEGRGDGALPEMRVDAVVASRTRHRLSSAGVPVRALEAHAVVGLNPGRPYPAKAWASERFVALAREMVARGRHVLITWGPGEDETAREISAAAGEGVTMAPPATLEELPGVLACCRVLVTIDSGLKHLAACVRTPTVTLFGSTDPREWHMGGERDRVIWKGLSCSPCRRRSCPFGAPCMDIAVSEVAAAVAAIEGVS